MSKQRKASRLITPREIEQRLDICQRTLFRMVKRGSFPAPIKLPGMKGHRRWDEHVVENWIEDQRQAREARA